MRDSYEAAAPSAAPQGAQPAEPLRELMESYLAQASEATFDGFAQSVVAAQITRLHETCYRMGFESGWRIRGEAAASPADAAPVPQEVERDVQVEGFLCRAWGETDLPEARLVRSREDWEAFVIEAQWGPDASLDADDREAVDAQVRYIAADMEDNGTGQINFEIGGISVERVTFVAMNAGLTIPAKEQTNG